LSVASPATPVVDSTAFRATPPVDTTAVRAAPAPTLRVGRVSVVGNRSADSLRVIRTFEVFPGQLYSDEAVRRGIRKLFALGIFEDISTERDEHEGVVDLTIHVQERPRIAKFVFHGNQRKSNSDLEKKMLIRVGEAYSPSAVHTQVDTLLKLYTDDGFAQATITPFADTLEDRHQVAIRFEIHEGEKVKIEEVQVVGVTAVKTKVLRKQMKTKPGGLFGGGDVKDENFDLDRQKIEAYYHNHGYRDARVVDHQLKPGDTPKHLIYVVTVEEGPLYRFGKITWTGATVVPSDELARAWRPRMWSPYDASAIERAQGEAYSAYAERGYLYLNVEPRETVRDSMVDIEFHVGEGLPSNVRFVNIAGNKGTREKVIRRQLSIHEGDRFRRSALVRTQGDLMRLGLFEDVQMDFAPAESTDVDLNVKVKEKQVGTASAGAGYTSQNGLTGFIELGHNNVLGNAQVLQLHLERGGSSSNYLLSFTEPWFHDTPTLLGFSLYNSYLLRDYYREKRVGGSAQIGRPLTHPDYSHIAVAYRLENVTYDSLSAIVSTSVQDSIVLEDIEPGKPRRTSGATITFNRSTANNPFYPTRGSRLTLTGDLTGGPFGGTVSYMQYRMDARAYLPSLANGVTTMLKARMGVAGEYLWKQGDHVPAYERFRLGGGSTVDPLRGYDDYMIVPDQFNQIVIERFNPVVVKDTLGNVLGTHYDFRPVLVRYPGGRFFTAYTAEEQFPVVNPLHAVIFFDAGNAWDLGRNWQPLDLKMSAGIGFRLEIPLLGNIGFDYGYGFDRESMVVDRNGVASLQRSPRWVGHFLLGNVNN
jgi:outer membrane protein insertion porin family